MQHTRTQKNESGLADWFLAHAHSKAQGKVLDQRPEVKNFINYLWPVCDSYFSPLNPIFLSEVADVKAMNEFPVWMARDGLVPLLWFFKKNPAPGKLKSRLLIHRDFSEYVPPAWRSTIGTYRIEATPEGSAPGRSKHLLLIGLMMDTYCSIPALKNKLSAVSETLGKKGLADMRISAFIPPRMDAWGGEHHHEFSIQYCLELARYLGTEISALSWTQLQGMSSWAETTVVDLNENLLCADNFLLHKVMSTGARPFEHREPGQNEKNPRGTLVRLSPYHGVRIEKHITTDKFKGRFEEIAAIERVFLSEANQRFPWPNWVLGWARSECP
jgi:hypothetical protein